MGRGAGGKGSDHAGGGKRGGKGKDDDGPPSSDKIPQQRRDALRAKVVQFAADTSATQLALDSDINGLERKYLHEVAQEFGYTTQSFGQGRERYLTMFKPETSVAGSSAAVDEGSALKGKEVLSERATTVADPSSVSYTSVVLDADSQKRLLDFCQNRFSGGIPQDWKTYCGHLTICLGPLSKPQTEDNRSVADAVHSQIAKFVRGQKFALRIVSTGKNDDVMAVGVVGCVSCNRNPHITVATAPRTRPVASNNISKWEMLPAADQIVARGEIVEHGAEHIAAITGVDLRARVLSDTVLMATAFLSKQRGGRPGTQEQLEKMLQRRVLPNRIYAVHPSRLLTLVADSVPQPEALKSRMDFSLLAPAVDPFNLWKSPFNEVPAGVVDRVKLLAKKRYGESTAEMTPGKIFQCVSWLVSQARCRTSISSIDVFQGLVDNGAIKVVVDDNKSGKLEYLAPLLEFDASDHKEEIANVAYCCPWSLGPPPEPEKQEDDEAASGNEKGKKKK